MKEGWQTKKLGDLLHIQNGYAFNSKAFNAVKGLPLIRIRSLKTGIEFETRFDGEYDDKYVVNSGDLLIGMDGEFGCYEWKGGPSLLNQRVCRLQEFTSHLLPRYLFYGVNRYLKAIEEVTTFTTVKHLSSKQILNIQFPLPPLPEQKRIVAILDEAFAGISQAMANTERNLKNARELFETYLDFAFADHGSKWQETKLCKILSDQPRNGWSPPAKFHSDAGTPVLTLSSVTGFNFDKSKVKHTSSPVNIHSHYWVHNGDLLISRSNTHELVGHVAICSGITEPVIYPDLIMKMKVNSSIASTDFIYYQLRSRKLRAIISNSATGANPTMKKINKTIVQNLSLILPSLKEQEEITRSIESLSKKSQRYSLIAQQKLSALAELKQSILQKAFTGQLITDNLPL